MFSQLVKNTTGFAARNGAILRYASTDLTKSNWKQDVVYLVQFPRLPNGLPNASPYCLKIETVLRVYDIKHEIISSMFKRSSRGLLPFIELNGKQIADSQVIVWTLQKHFGIDDGLKGEDKGVGRAVERMLDLSTNYALLYDKSVLNGPVLLSRPVSGAPIPQFVANFLGKKFSDTAKKRIDGVFGRLSKDEIHALLRKDIEAIDAILGDKKFLFGDRISLVDCTVFGQLGATYYLPYRQKITDLLDDEFPRVKAYLQRIRTHYYPEWKDD
ncbi:hypothetical protein WR25_00051 [Diploscapter pachys]|uniref:GST C-terminal domain-containing protein n=1 Tax=Diploscapter pachys TaxID=2018661 RepID=A0A2A2KED0_9BILA|nr:hypothetical protein WR25_00051 [Diploscapter pachys]